LVSRAQEFEFFPRSRCEGGSPTYDIPPMVHNGLAIAPRWPAIADRPVSWSYLEASGLLRGESITWRA